MGTGATDVPGLNKPSHEQSFLYDAFISYDHDARGVAAGIRRGLRRIGRRLGQLSALRVFRDATDLAASSDLWGKVVDAMARSRYPIVVLSPHAVHFKRVNKEVAHWLEHRGSDRLMLVVANGSLQWEAAQGMADDLRRKPEPFIRRACRGNDRRSCPTSLSRLANLTAS